MNNYYNGDMASVFDAIGKIDEEYEDLKARGELDNEAIFKLNYRKLMQGIKLNTGYFRF